MSRMDTILLLDTSSPVCALTLSIAGELETVTWEANRELGKGMLGFLQAELEKRGKGWPDITGLVFHRGPGSFTGLRIGATVFNTMADTLSVPIVGATGDDWQRQGLKRLSNGQNDKVVLPEYGGEAHITSPRK